MADSIVLPPAHVAPSKGQSTIVVSAGEKNINRAKSTPRVGSQTSTKGSIWKDLFVFYICSFFRSNRNNCHDFSR